MTRECIQGIRCTARIGRLTVDARLRSSSQNGASTIRRPIEFGCSRTSREHPAACHIRNGRDHPAAVPTISRFHGITIQMFFKEHGVPHFHARYGGQIAVLTVESLEVLRGGLPSRHERLVREWAALHRDELMRNWELARAGKPLEAIEPLK